MDPERSVCEFVGGGEEFLKVEGGKSVKALVGEEGDLVLNSE